MSKPPTPEQLALGMTYEQVCRECPSLAVGLYIDPPDTGLAGEHDCFRLRYDMLNNVWRCRHRLIPHEFAGRLVLARLRSWHKYHKTGFKTKHRGAIGASYLLLKANDVCLERPTLAKDHRELRVLVEDLAEKMAMSAKDQ